MAPVVIGPVEGATKPWGAPDQSVLDERGYVAEEYFIEGEVEGYFHAEGTKPTADGRWVADVVGVAGYRTRILVVRPASRERFNGTVLLCWQNVSAGHESGVPSAGELYEGYAWVAVSAQEVGIYGFPAGVRFGGSQMMSRPLMAYDSDRYGSLVHPGDQGSFGIFAEAARAVGAKRQGDIDPMCGLEVERVIGVGGSQSAMRLCAFINGVHRLDPVIDGFLLAVWEGRAPRLEEGPVALGVRTIVRTDLEVPVLVVNSEFEVMAVAGLPIADTDSFRLWEVTGTPHAPARTRAAYGDDDGRTANTLSWMPVHEAGIRAVHRWLTEGIAPAVFHRVEAEPGPPSRVRRDGVGNGIGGLRLPEIEAPTSVYRGLDFGTGRAPAFGSERPLGDDELRALYPSRQAFLDRRRAAVDGLVAAGALRPEDVEVMLARAADAASSLPVE